MAALIASGNVSFVYKDFVLPSHKPYAQMAAEAAGCAADQGKFWAYHGYLLAHQKQWTKAELKDYARLLTLDTVQFDQCYDSGKHTAEVDASSKEAMDLNLPGTPSFLLNGRMLDLKTTNLGRLDLVIKPELQK